ncbi:MAG: hypothetical protein J0H92_03340 [Sphingobacteriales bacterium]|nr:hypothetical protein [Sphingobacteriales bacterium]OJW35274.1 MAG: hypothetical protein BGO54_03810 [Sphingobacteriales bacterium 46-32]
MKKEIKQMIFASGFSLIAVMGWTQDETPSTPKWVSDKGYWVVESNINQPQQYTIRFYNNQHELIGRKDLSGIKLNVRKRKTKMMLRESLESSLEAWAKNKRTGSEIAKNNE